MNRRNILLILLLIPPAVSHTQRSAPPGTDSLQPRGRHALTVSTLSCLNGMLPLTYAQAIGRRLAIQVSAGPTFRNPFNDVQQGIYREGEHTKNYHEGAWVPDIPMDIDDNYENANFRKHHPGLMAGAGLNYYLRGQALNGSHVGVLAQFRRYNSSAERWLNAYASDARTKEDPIREWSNLTDLVLSYGISRTTRGGFFYAFNLQLGLSYQRRHMQDVGYMYVSNPNGPGDYVVINGVQDYNVLRPYFNIDLRLGAWW